MRTRRKKDKIVLQTVDISQQTKRLNRGNPAVQSRPSEKAKFATLAFHLMNRQLLQGSQ